MIYVNHGRWVINCPAENCEAGLLFNDTLVCDCRDESVCDHSQQPCGTPINAVLPDEAAAIMHLLANRPKANRNWSPPESLDDLKTENLSHGVGV